jgi:hypothetical protein
LVNLHNGGHDKQKKVGDLGSIHDVNVVALQGDDLKLLLEAVGAIGAERKSEDQSA